MKKLFWRFVVWLFALTEEKPERGPVMCTCPACEAHRRTFR